MSQHTRKSDRPDKDKSLELSKKAEIVKCLTDGTMKVAEVASEYGLPHTTVSTWKKQSDKIIQDSVKSTPKRKRLRQLEKCTHWMSHPQYPT